jgi:hypothetical protein
MCITDQDNDPLHWNCTRKLMVCACIICQVLQPCSKYIEWLASFLHKTIVMILQDRFGLIANASRAADS